MNIWLYILISALVAFLIRATPLVLIRREIRSRTLRSFLYYVPYVTLAVMTFPPSWRPPRAPWRGSWPWSPGLPWPGSAAASSRWRWPAVWWYFWRSCSWCDLPVQAARSRSQCDKNSPVPPYRRHRAVCFTPF